MTSSYTEDTVRILSTLTVLVATQTVCAWSQSALMPAKSGPA